MAKPALDRLIIEPGGSYTTEEACAWLGWDRHTFYREVRKRGIPILLGGKGWKMVGEDLLRLRRTLTQKPGALLRVR